MADEPRDAIREASTRDLRLDQAIGVGRCADRIFSGSRATGPKEIRLKSSESLDSCGTFKSIRRSSMTRPNSSTVRSTIVIRRADAISQHSKARRPEPTDEGIRSRRIREEAPHVESQRVVGVAPTSERDHYFNRPARHAAGNSSASLIDAADEGESFRLAELTPRFPFPNPVVRHGERSALLFAVYIQPKFKRRRSAPLYEMSNIARMLKEEITKIARRESRASLERTRKVLSQQRQEIASLKARLKQLERSAFASERDQRKTAAQPPAEESTKQVRFMPKGLVSMRQRLGLSVADLAKLLSVSDQTIYNWERGVSKPRPEHRAKLVSLRGVGKKELQSYLAQSSAG